MKRRHKIYERPKHLYDKVRIGEENKLVESYGLKNKREIWKTEALVRYLRNRAKSLITASEGDKQAFFKKLNAVGLNVNSIADVLALTKKDMLKRRLATILVEKKFVRTPFEGRQFIVHKRVLIGGRTVSSPSYLVRVNEENLISIKSATRQAIKPNVETPEEKAETDK